MGRPAHNTEARNPHMVGKERGHRGIVSGQIRVGRHRIHVMGHQQTGGAKLHQVNRQIGVPRGLKDFFEPPVPHWPQKTKQRKQFGRSGIIQQLSESVANAPVSAIEVAGHDKEHGDRHVMVRNIRHPQAARHRIEPTLKGEEIGVGRPVKREKRLDALGKAGEQLHHQALIENELMGQRHIVRGDPRVHQPIGRHRHVNQMPRPA